MLRIMSAVVVMAAALAWLLGSAGCESMGSAGGSSLTSIKDLVGQWTVTQLDGTDIGKLLPASLKKPSLDFGSDGKVTGTTGLNRLTSMIDTEALMKGQFKLAPAATTKMAGPKEAMDVESKFLNALTNAKNFKLSGDSLSLTDGAKELVRFVKGG